MVKAAEDEKRALETNGAALLGKGLDRVGDRSPARTAARSANSQEQSPEGQRNEAADAETAAPDLSDEPLTAPTSSAPRPSESKWASSKRRMLQVRHDDDGPPASGRSLKAAANNGLNYVNPMRGSRGAKAKVSNPMNNMELEVVLTED